MSTEELRFPRIDYHLDESDPDIAVLRRQDGAFVAAFSARGATRDGFVEAARKTTVNSSGSIGPGEVRTPRSSTALKSPSRGLHASASLSVAR